MRGRRHRDPALRSRAVPRRSRRRGPPRSGGQPVEGARRARRRRAAHPARSRSRAAPRRSGGGSRRCSSSCRPRLARWPPCSPLSTRSLRRSWRSCDSRASVGHRHVLRGEPGRGHRGTGVSEGPGSTIAGACPRSSARPSGGVPGADPATWHVRSPGEPVVAIRSGAGGGPLAPAVLSGLPVQLRCNDVAADARLLRAEAASCWSPATSRCSDRRRSERRLEGWRARTGTTDVQRPPGSERLWCGCPPAEQGRTTP